MTKLLYNDIKKYPRSNYSVDQEIWDLPRVLDRYKTQQIKFGYKFELNPDFQRGNVWTYEQKSLYIEHLLREGTNGRDIYFNHPGWMNSFKGDMVCLDGLQRITAILDFLNNEIDVFSGYYYEDIEMRHFNTVRFHILDLKSRKDVLYWYIQFNSAGTFHTNEEINRVVEMWREEK